MRKAKFIIYLENPEWEISERAIYESPVTTVKEPGLDDGDSSSDVLNRMKEDGTLPPIYDLSVKTVYFRAQDYFNANYRRLCESLPNLSFKIEIRLQQSESDSFRYTGLIARYQGGKLVSSPFLKTKPCMSVEQRISIEEIKKFLLK